MKWFIFFLSVFEILRYVFFDVFCMRFRCQLARRWSFIREVFCKMWSSRHDHWPVGILDTCCRNFWMMYKKPKDIPESKSKRKREKIIVTWHMLHIKAKTPYLQQGKINQWKLPSATNASIPLFSSAFLFSWQSNRDWLTHRKHSKADDKNS